MALLEKMVMRREKVALIFAADENFASLAKGLVLSILSQRGSDLFSLNMIDIGCSPKTLQWMRSKGVNIGKFSLKKYYRNIKASTKPYQDALFCRPFVGDIFPGYDIYVWCDSDIWIQDIKSLFTYIDIVNKDPSKVPISPLVDISYTYFYKEFSEYAGYNRIWYTDIYGAVVASTYANRAIFSAGVFAMHRNNPIWKAWAIEIASILKRQMPSQTTSHLSEQTVLNYLLYSTDCYIPVAATHNYNCHIGCAARTRKPTVHFDIPPYDDIGVIHLTCTSKFINQYIDDGLLYERGDYLGKAEIDNLRSISHC